MPQLRRDPIVDRWIIISPDRANRPFSLWAKQEKNGGAYCPFCEGNEHSTPKETFAIRKSGFGSNGVGWTLRVTPNKFPALEWDGIVETSDDGIYRTVSGVGAHEVIIETPRHDEDLADLDVERVADLFKVVRLRCLEFKKDDRLQCIQFFKNHGAQAGASLEHSHSQIIAMPVVSKLIQEELSGAERRFAEINTCVFCEIIKKEIAEGVRMIAENRDFVAIAPFAPRFAYESWILPKEHCPYYEDADDAHAMSLAEIYKDVLGGINKLLDNPPYNMTLHTAPFNGGKQNKEYHWFVKTWPVTTNVAGFEWGSGFYINTVAPERAAEQMRNILFS